MNETGKLVVSIAQSKFYRNIAFSIDIARCGVTGFENWYEQVKGIFKPDCQHQVEQVYVKEADNVFEVNIRVRLIADTSVNSPFKGKAVNQLVNETWMVDCPGDQEICIQKYAAKLVSS